jgi:hypothetical protein
MYKSFPEHKSEVSSLASNFSVNLGTRQTREVTFTLRCTPSIGYGTVRYGSGSEDSNPYGNKSIVKHIIRASSYVE